MSLLRMGWKHERIFAYRMAPRQKRKLKEMDSKRGEEEEEGAVLGGALEEEAAAGDGEDGERSFTRKKKIRRDSRGLETVGKHQLSEDEAKAQGLLSELLG